MEKPLVTVVVGCYNHSRYIVECLNSIKAQTYNNIELLIGDDASPDNSVEVIDHWLQENNYPAKTVYHDKNTGVVKMLNECMEHVHGKHVKFIAADDFLEATSIEKCVTMLEDIGDDLGMVFTDFVTIDENSRKIEDLFTYKNADFFEDEYFLNKTQLLHRNIIIAPTVLLRTSVLNDTGPYRENFILEDHDRWLRINEKKRIGFINEKLCYYRVLPTSVTSTRRNQMVEEDILLKMHYDRSGIAKNFIDWFFIDRIFQRVIIPAELLKGYEQYPHKDWFLLNAAKYNFPPVFLKIYKKLQSIFFSF